MTARHFEKLSTTDTQKPNNLRLHASLAQLNCQHLRIHSPPMRVLRIQYLDWKILGRPMQKNRRSSVPARRSAGVQVDRIKGRGATNEQPIELGPAETHVGHGFWDQDLPQQRAFARMAVHTVTGR